VTRTVDIEVVVGIDDDTADDDVKVRFVGDVICCCGLSLW